MNCPICSKQFRPRQIVTVRQSWAQAGGYGTVPPEARVHPACDRREQRAMQAGEVRLSDLWGPKQKEAR
jgi:hypothetical protein